MKEQQNITLENYNQTALGDPILTSPRSIAACQRLGIIPFDLIQKSVPLLKLVFPDLKLDNEGWFKKQQHDEDRRIQKLRMALAERANIIENELNNPLNEERHIQSQQNGSTMIDNVRRQLQKIKGRQQRELKQMIDHEIKTQQMIEQQEDKKSKQQEREYMRMMQLQQKRDQQEYDRIMREQEKIRKQKEVEFHQRQIAQEQYYKEQEKERIEELKQVQHDKDRRIKDEEHKQQQMAFQMQTFLIQQKQDQDLQQKRMIMESKAEMRSQVLNNKYVKLLAEQKQQRLEVSLQAQQILEQKIMMAKYKNQMELQRVRENFEKKQQLTEMKREQFQAEKLHQLQEASRIQGEHHQQIQQVIERNAAQEEYKKLEYIGKQWEAEQRMQQVDQNNQILLQQRKQQEAEHEQFRQQVRLNNEMQQDQKIENYKIKMMKKDQDLQNVQDMKRYELKQKGINEIIRQSDKKDNVNRILQMQDYQREQLKQKIDQKMNKAEGVQIEKNILLEQRFQLRREVDMQKQVMQEEFQKAKKTGKLSPQTLSQMAHDDQYNQIGTQESSSKKRPQSAKAYYPPKQSTPKQKQKTINPESLLSSQYKKKQIDHLKVQQNQEMIKLLQQEQMNEEQREQVLMSIDGVQEQLRVETIFGSERAKAQVKIQKLQDYQLQQLQNFIQ